MAELDEIPVAHKVRKCEAIRCCDMIERVLGSSPICKHVSTATKAPHTNLNFQLLHCKREKKNLMCQPNTPDLSRINPIVTLQQKSQKLSLLMQFSETQFQRFINHIRWVCVSRSTKGHTYLPHKRVAKLLS